MVRKIIIMKKMTMLKWLTTLMIVCEENKKRRVALVSMGNILKKKTENKQLPLSFPTRENKDWLSFKLANKIAPTWWYGKSFVKEKKTLKKHIHKYSTTDNEANVPRR